MFLLAMPGNTPVFVFYQFIRELLIVASSKNTADSLTLETIQYVGLA